MQFVNNFKGIIKYSTNQLRKSIDLKINGGCLVLLYHRVCEYETDPQLLCVTPDNFEKQILFLKSEYHLLSVDDFFAVISKNEKFPERSVLITFDDGYADNLKFALPILEKYSTTALFYICTGNIDTSREFWWDEVERHILLSLDFPEVFKITIEDSQFYSSKEIVERKKLYHDLLPVLRSLNSEERNKVVDSISKLTGNTPPRNSHRSMTWNEVTMMSSSPSAVMGAHTLNHPSLTACSLQEQKNEIEGSKVLLEGKLNRAIEHFSYPFGTKSDFNSHTIEIAEKTGFKMVAANFPYIANRKSDRFAIPRFLIRDWDLPVFQKELNSFLK